MCLYKVDWKDINKYLVLNNALLVVYMCLGLLTFIMYCDKMY